MVRPGRFFSTKLGAPVILFAGGFLVGLLLAWLASLSGASNLFVGAGLTISAMSAAIGFMQMGRSLAASARDSQAREPARDGGDVQVKQAEHLASGAGDQANGSLSASSVLNTRLWQLPRWRTTLSGRPWRLLCLGLAVILTVLSVADSLAADHNGPYTRAVALWIVANLCFAASFVPWARLRGVAAPASGAQRWISDHRRELLVIAAILMLGLALRAVDLEHIPANFAGDEGEMGLQARLFLEGEPISPFGTSWMGHQTMWFWLQSLVMHLLGQSVADLRLLSVLFGTLGLLSCYLLVRELFGPRLAGIASFLLAVFPFQLHFSRIAISSIADPFWSALVFFLLIRGARTRRIGYFVAGGLALGFSQYFYHGMRLLIITLAVFFAYWIIQDRRVLLSNVGNWAVGAAASLVTAAPLIGYYIVQPDKFWEHYIGMGIVPSGWLQRTIEQTGQSAPAILLERFRQAILSYNAIPDYSPFYASAAPLLDSLSGMLFVLGILYSIYRLRDRRYFLFVEWLILALILGVVMIIDENGSERVVTTAVPVMFFVATGLDSLAALGSRLWRRSWKVRWAVVAAGLVAITVIGIQFYFVEYTPLRAYSGDGGWRFTEMSRYFMAQQEPFKVYFLGAPYDFIDHGTVRYMVPDLDGMDVQDPLTGPPDFVDRSRVALFVFTPKRPDDYNFVAQAFPNGERIDYFKPGGEELFWIYRVAPQ